MADNDPVVDNFKYVCFVCDKKNIPSELWTLESMKFIYESGSRKEDGTLKVCKKCLERFKQRIAELEYEESLNPTPVPPSPTMTREKSDAFKLKDVEKKDRDFTAPKTEREAGQEG